MRETVSVQENVTRKIPWDFEIEMYHAFWSQDQT